ncbi:hypothetical protein BaRGS_00031388 [Batillaria attramentaria]|uniref:Uncharacterized protein n=1 Tax=Batillaria attramentaria TaxID=370345 RepID=A0ABD0JRT0_9CAEN
MLPVCRKFPTTQGPHSTCLLSAESYLAHYLPRHSRWMQASHYKCTLLSCHVSVVIYISTYLLSFIFFFLLCLVFLVSYVGLKLFLRLQLKLALFLLLVQRRPFEFAALNKFFVLCLHIMLVLIGGFAYLALSFVDM